QKRNFPGTARVGNPAAFFASPAASLPAGKTCSTIASSDFANANIFNATSGACSLFTRFSLANYAAGVAQYNQGLNVIQTFLGPLPRHGDQVLNFPNLDWAVKHREHASLRYSPMRREAPAGRTLQA